MATNASPPASPPPCWTRFLIGISGCWLMSRNCRKSASDSNPTILYKRPSYIIVALSKVSVVKPRALDSDSGNSTSSASSDEKNRPCFMGIGPMKPFSMAGRPRIASMFASAPLEAEMRKGRVPPSGSLVGISQRRMDSSARPLKISFMVRSVASSMREFPGQ